MSEKQKNEEKKKKGFWKTLLKIILFIILCIVLFVVGFVGYSTIKNGWGLTGIIKTAVGSDKDLEELDEFQVLILGISEDESSVALTDTIIVASYNPKTQKAMLLSIPRDTFIGDNKLKTNSYDKINAVFQQKGAEGVIQKVNNLTGLEIKNYLVISNNALSDLVDEIGGVYFDVPMKMDYDSGWQKLHIHLEPGYQKLNGEQAEWLVRFRKNNNGTTYSGEYGNDDYGRMRTQRDFIKAVAKQTLQAKNITKIGGLIDLVNKNVTSNIDWEELKNYIPYVVEFNTNDIETANIPGESERLPAKTGLWFFIADEEGTKEYVKELIDIQNGENVISSATKSKLNIEILNGSGSSGNLTKMVSALKKEGYNVYKKGTTSKTAKTTIINKSNISEEITENLKTILGAGIVQNSSDENDKTDITIIIGTDY